MSCSLRLKYPNDWYCNTVKKPCQAYFDEVKKIMKRKILLNEIKEFIRFQYAIITVIGRNSV